MWQHSARRLAAICIPLAVLIAVCGLAPSASADGTNGRIFVTSNRSLNLDIWSIGSDGTDAQQLTNDIGADRQPAVSPDGGTVLFASNRNGDNDIYRMDHDGSNESALISSPSGETDPIFSFDGSKIAFVRAVGLEADLYLADADGTNEVQLTAGSDTDSTPAFSPDGSAVAFVRNSTVMTVAIADLTETSIGAGTDPAYLPDGRFVFRFSNEIYVMDGDGANRTRLTTNSVPDREPAASPDGTQIVYSSLVGGLLGDLDLIVMDVDGTDAVNITPGLLEADQTPFWAPELVGGLPITTIDAAPQSATNDTTPHFEFHANEPATFECSLTAAGSESFNSCTSPLDASVLGEGNYMFKVRATDIDSNVESPPKTVSFTVDTTAPTVTSANGTTPTNDGTPSVTFTVDDASATASCALTPAGGSDSFSSCASPFTPAADLADGAYTFRAYATDAAGNVSATESFAFAVDATAPAASVTGPGPGATNDRTPTFSFTFDDAPASVTCSIALPGHDAFVVCADDYTAPANLADGAYEFKVRADDALGNTSTASRAFSVDGTAPGVVITTAPPVLTNDTTPTITFDHGDAVVALCDLRLVGAPAVFLPCTSPFNGVAPPGGPYVFTVRGTDVVGNTAEASTPFTVDVTPPVAAIGGPTATRDRTPAFTFSFDEPLAPLTTECGVARSTAPPIYAPCASPFEPTSLTDGTYLFRVRATDLAGNTSAAATHAFRVDTVGPVTTITGKVTTTDRTPTFRLRAEAGATFRCAIDSTTAYRTCRSPYTTKLLRSGRHALRVKATDTLGNIGPVKTFRFTVL